MSRRDERVGLIRALEAARGGTHVIAYLTSTRPNLEAPMAMDAIPLVHRHLEAIGTPKDQTRIDLFIHSNGGDGVVPWRLVTLIREYCAEFAVLVPHRAFSAATLAALGADRVIMHRMGMLGPTDPTVVNPFNPSHPHRPGQLLGISVEDVSAYINVLRDELGLSQEDAIAEGFGHMARRVHPLALGNVKRAAAQSRMLAEKLLRQRNEHDLSDPELAEIVEELSSRLYFHGHPINRNEAREDLSPAVGRGRRTRARAGDVVPVLGVPGRHALGAGVLAAPGGVRGEPAPAARRDATGAPASNGGERPVASHSRGVRRIAGPDRRPPARVRGDAQAGLVGRGERERVLEEVELGAGRLAGGEGRVGDGLSRRRGGRELGGTEECPGIGVDVERNRSGTVLVPW
jgi:serine dehydrogenase proteinase